MNENIQKFQEELKQLLDKYNIGLQPTINIIDLNENPTPKPEPLSPNQKPGKD